MSYLRSFILVLPGLSDMRDCKGSAVCRVDLSESLQGSRLPRLKCGLQGSASIGIPSSRVNLQRHELRLAFGRILTDVVRSGVSRDGHYCSQPQSGAIGRPIPLLPIYEWSMLLISSEKSLFLKSSRCYRAMCNLVQHCQIPLVKLGWLARIDLLRQDGGAMRIGH